MADDRFKVKEIYKDIKALPPVIVRADGRNFKESLARLRFKKPYDLKFEKAMVSAGRALMESSGLGPLWVYTFSDELNIFSPSFRSTAGWRSWTRSCPRSYRAHSRWRWA